ncbi:hypothetical protein Y710_18565, partial [Gordonia sp. QH-12]
MPREFAKAWFSMFTDDDFACQDSGDKWLYMVLLGQPALNYAGVQPMNMRRWQRAMRDVSGTVPSEAEMHVRLNRMERRRYVFVDPDTGETLVRTFMRSDGVARQPNVLKSALRALAHVESPKLASVLASELDQLVMPEVKSDKVADDIAALNGAARTHLEGLAEGFAEPFPEPFPEGLPEPLAEGFQRPGETEPFPEPFPEGLEEGSVVVQVGVVSTDPALKVGEYACARDDDPTKTPSSPGSATNPDHEPPSRCTEHRDLPADVRVPPCGPCANFRKAHERWTERQSRRAAELRRSLSTFPC